MNRPKFNSTDAHVMNTIHSLALFALLSTCLLSGCDTASRDFESSRKAELRSKSSAIAEEIATLKDQNSQLTQLLKEAESKLDSDSSELETVKQSLGEAKTTAKDLEIQLHQANLQLSKVRDLAGQIEAAIATNSADIKKQMTALSQILPQPTQPDKADENEPSVQNSQNAEPKENVKR